MNVGEDKDSGKRQRAAIQAPRRLERDLPTPLTEPR